MPPFKSQLAQVLSKAHEDGLHGAYLYRTQGDAQEKARGGKKAVHLEA